MTLQQLRCLCEVINQGLNLSRTARALHTSQPAVTKIIRGLEHELGIEILVRKGPRIVAVSDAGQKILGLANQVLRDVNNLRVAASDSRDSSHGELRIGTTHIQAKYGLVRPIQSFVAAYPDVLVSFRRGTPEEIANWVSSGEVDLGISTMPEKIFPNLVNLNIARVPRCIIAPARHPILKLRKPTLKDLSKYRLVIYDTRYTTGQVIEQAFLAANIVPRIAMKATDADVARAYVSAGLGIAIIEAMAIEPNDTTLSALNADHLFPASSSWIVLRRDQYLRQYMYAFIAMVTPKWTRSEIEMARATPSAHPMFADVPSAAGGIPQRQTRHRRKAGIVLKR